MALTLKDRVLETASAPGTGSVSLLGAVTGYQSFSSAIGNANTCYYTIADQSGANWEVGIGTYTSSGNTLARTTVLSSSNGGSLTNFASGTQNVFVTYPSEKSVYLDASGNVSALGTIASGTWNASTIVTTYGGTGLSSYTAGDLPYYATGTALSKLGIGTSGYILSSSGTAPQWVNSISIGSGTFTSVTDSGLTAGRVNYNGTGGLLVDSANLTFDGTTLTANKVTSTNDASISGLTVGKGGGAVAANTVVGNGALNANTTGSNNSAFGQNALNANTTANSNSAFGINSMLLNTTGTQNSAFGQQSLNSNTTGSYNSAFGLQSLFSNTTALYNTALGYQAGYSNTTGRIDAIGALTLFSNTTGVANVAIGGSYADNIRSALYGNTTGSYNIAVGQGALAYNTTASYNTAIGYQSLYSNTTGSPNVAIGYQSLYSNTTANNNTALGFQAVYSNTTGTSLVAVGRLAMYSNTTGVANVAIGADYPGVSTGPLYYNTTGGYNIAVGVGALANNTTASNNTAVGYQAGYSITTGSYNTFLGQGAGYLGTALVTGSNSTYIGYNAQASSSSATGEMVFSAGGVVGKGNNTTVIGNPCYQGNNSTTWSVTSDQRIKENIATLSGNLDIITKLRPVSFNYKTGDKKKDISFIAQEYQQVLPDQVNEHAANPEEKEVAGTDTLLGLTPNLIPYLVGAIQEQQALIADLTNRIKTLENK